MGFDWGSETGDGGEASVEEREGEQDVGECAEGEESPFVGCGD